MADGPAAGLAQIDAILARGDLAEYYLAHSARADLCRRLGRRADAIAAYERALALTKQEPERRFLMRRLAQLRRNGSPSKPVVSGWYRVSSADLNNAYRVVSIGSIPINHIGIDGHADYRRKCARSQPLSFSLCRS
jgi:hypothetical protein